MLLSTLSLIGAGVSALGGAIGSAVNNKKARDEENRSYQYASDFLNSQYYRDPLSTVGNRALLKNLGERMKDQNEALQNRSVAAGATTENQLAASQANNETMGRVYTSLLQGEDARRDALAQQKLGLEQKHSANIQNSFYQDAQNWQSWGAAMGDAAMSYGNALISGGADKTINLGGLFGKKKQ